MTDVFDKELPLRLKRYLDLNRERLVRAKSVMTVKAQKFLSLIPLFLNYNDPHLPGFKHNDVPCGIDGFVLDDFHKDWLKARLSPEDKLTAPKRNEILGLYAMGSTSSIGQGVHSDLDIWVCVGHDISAQRLSFLNEKCRFLSAFAHGCGVDLNLFVTLDNRFTQGSSDSLDSDNCGSAQNLFLLDEFYRTSFRICGRYIIWFLITTKEEADDYAFYVDKVLNHPSIKKEEWFDFGTIVNSSPGEYFGSGLWLLYKGIDSPFKAAIKILLMEAYSNDYPQTDLLSSKLKDYVLNHDGYGIELDAYYLMYEKVSDYLKSIGDVKRLKLLRVCFFLKIYSGLDGLSDGTALSYRRNLLDKLLSDWQMDKDFIEQIINRDAWKFSFVSRFYQSLYYSLLESYRALLRFSVRHGIEYAITSDDAGILSRKLYAAFDRYPGKILLFNSDLTLSIKERYLTFIRPNKNSLCKKGWHLYSSAPDDIGILASSPIIVGSSLVEVVAWACFNGILTRLTAIYTAGQVGIVSSSRVKQLASDITALKSSLLSPISDLDLQRPRSFKECLVVLNFEDDPTLMRDIESADLDYGSSLCCGRERLCLVGSIDLLMINSWGEACAISFPSGEDGVIQLISSLVRVSRNAEFADAGKLLSSIKISSYASSRGDLIRYDLQSLLRQVFLKMGTGEELSFKIGRNTFLARDDKDRGIIINRLSYLGSESENISVLSPYSMRPEFALQVPGIVECYATLGVMQYFFAPLVEGWEIFIVNERNEVEIYNHYVGSRATLVNAINRFYTRQSEGSSTSSVHFNLPQYFVLSPDLKAIHPFTIKGQPDPD